VLRAVPDSINSSSDLQPYREGKAEAYVDAAAWVTELKNRLCYR
jgi:hypothetical protein